MKGVVELRYFGRAIRQLAERLLVQLQLLQVIAVIAHGYKSSFAFYPFNYTASRDDAEHVSMPIEASAFESINTASVFNSFTRYHQECRMQVILRL
jgi:hypothetical protein